LAENGAGEVGTGSRVREVRMVEQIEEVGIEPEAHPLVDLEGLADSKINVRVHWPWQRSATGVGIAPEPTVIVNRRIVQAVTRRSELGCIKVLIRPIDFLAQDRVRNLART
jgi:hypothetical protein